MLTVGDKLDILVRSSANNTNIRVRGIFESQCFYEVDSCSLIVTRFVYATLIAQLMERWGMFGNMADEVTLTTVQVCEEIECEGRSVDELSTSI